MKARFWRGAGWLTVALLLLAPPAPGQAAATLEETLIEVAARIQPAVVAIAAEQSRPTITLPVPTPDLPDDLPFGLSRGTGMLWRAEDDHYLILTNAHVVRGARNGHVRVQIIAEREERDGTVLGADRRNDTAVVKIARKPEDKLQCVTLGRNRDLRVGSFVLAVGSPFGFNWSVSLGVVSGLDRELNEPQAAPSANPIRYRGLIQTDASINPGNSGGPLVNLKGEVVGINFAILSPGQAGNVGVGFAIPIDRALRSAEDLVRYGRVKRGFLGVQVLDLDEAAKRQKATLEEVRQLLGVDRGAYVAEVTPETPADKAGVRPGDVIVSTNGQAIDSSGALVDAITAIEPGTEVRLEVVRQGEKLTLSLILAELPAELSGNEPGAGEPTPPAARPDPLGLTVAPLTAQKAAELGIEARGVLITAVEEGSLAAAIGIVPEAVILAGRRGREATVFGQVADYQRFIEAAAREGALVALTLNLPRPEGQGRVTRSLLLKVPQAPEGR